MPPMVYALLAHILVGPQYGMPVLLSMSGIKAWYQGLVSGTCINTCHAQQLPVRMCMCYTAHGAPCPAVFPASACPCGCFQAWHLSGDVYATHPGDKPWISEMYGYSFGAAKADVWHKWDATSMLYPSYVPAGGGHCHCGPALCVVHSK